MPELRMPSINQVALSGRIIQDLTSRPGRNASTSVADGQTETSPFQIAFTIAVNRPYKDAAGNWQQETATVPVRVSGKLAEYVAERISPGKAVFLTGRLNSQGETLEVVARHIQFLDQEEKTEEA